MQLVSLSSLAAFSCKFSIPFAAHVAATGAATRPQAMIPG